MNKEKLAKLQSQKVTRVGGARRSAMKGPGMKRTLNDVNQVMGLIFGRTGFVNVTNPVQCLRFRDSSGVEWKANFLDSPKTRGEAGIKIRYVKSARMFLVDQRYLDDLEKVEGEPMDPKEAAGPPRTSNHVERKFKHGLVKKLKAQKLDYVRACFQLADQVWDLPGSDVYSIGKFYYAVFGDLQDRQEMTPEMRAQIEDLMRQNQMLNEQSNQLAAVGNDDEEIPDLVAGTSDLTVGTDESVPGIQPVVDNGDSGDNGGFNPDDVEMVMNEGNVNREKAVQMLRENNGDMVDAIMACMS